MSGDKIPYQLQTNKYVERQLFMEIIDSIRVWSSNRNYVYASLSGHHMEDIKLVYSKFGFSRLISIEQNKEIWKRQEFNRPIGYIRCLQQSSDDFVKNYGTIMELENDAQAVVWLDYAAANERGKQLQELESLVEQLAPGDIFKITLNANPESYRKRATYSCKHDFFVVASNALEREIGADYFPTSGITPDDFKTTNFPRFLGKCVEQSALRGVSGENTLGVMPIGLYSYRDGAHQMLTATALMVDENEKKRFERANPFENWEFHSPNWQTVHNIRLPDLTGKERHYINTRIGDKDAYEIHRELPFKLDSDEAVSLDLLRDYIRHHRRYPQFVRAHA